MPYKDSSYRDSEAQPRSSAQIYKDSPAYQESQRPHSVKDREQMRAEIRAREKERRYLQKLQKQEQRQRRKEERELYRSQNKAALPLFSRRKKKQAEGAQTSSRERRRQVEQTSRQARRRLQEQAQQKPVTAKSLAQDLSRQAALEVGLNPENRTSGRRRSPSLGGLHEGVFIPPKHANMGILVITLVLLAFGLVMLFSASMTGALYDQDSSIYYISRQVVFTLLGLVLLFVICRINPKHWNQPKLAMILYVVTTILLVLVLIPGIGISVNGQRRWLPTVVVPRLSFQPSEIAKLATVYCGAVYFSNLRSRRARGDFSASGPRAQQWLDFALDFLVPGLPVLFWCLLISLQSHMSSVLIILLSLFVVFLASGIRPRSWAMALSVLLAISIGLGLIFTTFQPQIEKYMASNPRLAHLLVRLDVFSNQVDEDSNEAYQSSQALIGIGSGGLTGVGLGLGRQKFRWLPEIHNDYVFSNVCEELGFIGGSAVIVLFLIFFILGIYNSLHMQSIYMQVLACGYASLIAIQAFLSIAVNLMVIPPTGISLPLFSYGGTSNIFFLIGIGLLLATSKYGRKDEFAQLLLAGLDGAEDPAEGRAELSHDQETREDEVSVTSRQDGEGAHGGGTRL